MSESLGNLTIELKASLCLNWTTFLPFPCQKERNNCLWDIVEKAGKNISKHSEKIDSSKLKLKSTHISKIAKGRTQ